LSLEKLKHPKPKKQQKQQAPKGQVKMKHNTGGKTAHVATDHPKARQNGENVNPFGAMAFIAGHQSGPWTGWIGPAPV